jgi:hypothetical protein
MNKTPLILPASPARRASEEEAPLHESRSHLAWLLPWLLASIGFLMTLALLR